MEPSEILSFAILHSVHWHQAVISSRSIRDLRSNRPRRNLSWISWKSSAQQELWTSDRQNVLKSYWLYTSVDLLSFWCYKLRPCGSRYKRHFNTDFLQMQEKINIYLEACNILTFWVDNFIISPFNLSLTSCSSFSPIFPSKLNSDISIGLP